MGKWLNGSKTNLDLIGNCTEALKQYASGDRTPEVGGVVMDGAAVMGRCQQNVREIVEATAYGKERMWGEASCCATSTEQRLREHGYTRVALEDARSGDVVYMRYGGECGTCHQGAGHVGILYRQAEDGHWYLWQNTSYERRGLCAILLRGDQISRIVGVYRLFPLASNALMMPGGELKINWRGEWLDEEDVLLVQGEHYARVRAVAEAQGDVVKVDQPTGKVYVGPASWWE